jgi:hypothetical protein
LCWYLLPAFAAVLKIRSKKLAQNDTRSNLTDVVNTSSINLLFIDNLSLKFNDIVFSRKGLATDINASYSALLFKNESFYQFNFLILNHFKIVTFFI